MVVRILDLNDNAPRFSPASSTVRFSEASAVGSSLRLQTASDPDSPQNAQLTYTLNEQDQFYLDVSLTPI